MTEGSAATAAAASAPGLRGGGRPWGRKAEGGRRRAGGRAGGRGGGRRGEGAGAAAAAAGFPASSPRCAPRSLGRCSPRRPAAPRLGLPLWPRLLPPSGAGALRFPLFLLRLRLLPHKYQLLTPSPDLAAAAAATLPLRLGLARLPCCLGPPRRLVPTRLLACSLLLLGQSSGPCAAAAPPTQPEFLPDWGPPGRLPLPSPRARARAGWPLRVTSARRRLRRYSRGSRPPRCNSSEARRPGGLRAALWSGASTLQPPQPPPREPVPLLLTARETSLVGPFTSDPVLLLGSSGGNATHECRFLP
ncbi:sphingolipid delta(4)-desaturase/C4-monooxygenase DES2 isoform X2 [Bos mutus]|uniref:sphingolipid delta(4)-desaturase/C4-monooxygenase DES2 isoform X2 n=1 Tax=Bos mutus TaxID=72004 RepID=UPI0038B421A8